MKQNKYDEINFFSEYEKMPRSVQGLDAAGEWHVLKHFFQISRIRPYLI